MYSTCLYCHRSFGTNAVLETFPVGRRLAFDQARGRLWVVCRACEKWSLAPFDERWEALEDCEHLFRDARKRVASDNIGLARLDEGLELVRIGEPLRPEFAAWRYGDQFGRRRRRALLAGAGLTAVVVSAAAFGIWSSVVGGAGFYVYQVGTWGVQVAVRRRITAVLPGPDHTRLVVRQKHLHTFNLASPADHRGVFAVRVVHDRGETVLNGDAAMRAAALLLPKVNPWGASPRDVRDAVGAIEADGGPDAFLRGVWDRRGPGLWTRGAASQLGLGSLRRGTLVALEMALNEERERFALEGELALLELEWKEAEEIAAIADKLAIPEEVEQHLARLRGEVAK